MSASRLAPWILLGVVLSSGCHGTVAEVEDQPPTNRQPSTTAKIEDQPPTTAKIEDQPSTTAKIEECSWCPAPDPSGTTTAGEPASSQPDLMDRLQTTAAGTAFADVSEDQLLSDIRAICEAWKGDTSLEDTTARVSLARARLLGAPESESGLAAYTQLLETSADQRCLRDPTR